MWKKVIPVLPQFIIFSLCSVAIIFPSQYSLNPNKPKAAVSDSSHQMSKWAFPSLSAGLRQRCAPYVNIWRLFICGLQHSSLEERANPWWRWSGGKLCVLKALCSESRTYRLSFGNAQHGWWFVYIREADHIEVWDGASAVKEQSTCLFTLPNCIYSCESTAWWSG